MRGATLHAYHTWAVTQARDVENPASGIFQSCLLRYFFISFERTQGISEQDLKSMVPLPQMGTLKDIAVPCSEGGFLQECSCSNPGPLVLHL
jgi:hypothetical protein